MSRFVVLNDGAATEIYPLSLPDALPVFAREPVADLARAGVRVEPDEPDGPDQAVLRVDDRQGHPSARGGRSEEHTSELQSRQYLVCRLLLEKKTAPSSGCSQQRHTSSLH